MKKVFILQIIVIVVIVIQIIKVLHLSITRSGHGRVSMLEGGAY